ncbi:MAG: hypothetical protein RL386_692 [Bacteroidota bacterium]|jgi:tetratricopeptide (TPR) repeat protein
MAKTNKKKQQADEVLVDIVEVKDQAQEFYAKNEKLIVRVGGGLLILIAGLVALKFLYLEPRQKEAAEQMSQAQIQFERDSFAVALTKPGGGYSGFIEIADKYSSTRAGNLAKYYAGISYLNLGKYEAAISYLKEFKAKGEVLPITTNGAIADAYAELQQFDKAENYYQKAVSGKGNESITPIYLKKLGLFYEFRQKPEKALKVYQRIKSEFPNSSEATDVDKYIIRLGGE